MNEVQIQLMRDEATRCKKEADYHMKIADQLYEQADTCGNVARNYMRKAKDIMEGIEE